VSGEEEEQKQTEFVIMFVGREAEIKNHNEECIIEQQTMKRVAN